MIIFIEGPDGTGKSNIAEALADKYEMKVYKNDAEFRLYNEDSTNKFINLLRYSGPAEYHMTKLLSPDIIFDRNYISEYAYSKAFNRETDLSLIKAFDSLYSKLNSMVIYCYKEEYKNYEDDFIDLEKISEIDSAYRLYFDSINTLPIYMIDTTNENLPEQVRLLSAFVEKRRYDKIVPGIKKALKFRE
jgi:thymidylate kinase